MFLRLTGRILFITIHHMRLLMDSDCLIKLTKSRLKESVCQNFTVFIPQDIKKEVIDNAKGHPDATVIKDNVEKNLLAVIKSSSFSKKGEDSVFTLFRRGTYDAICSDDKRFIKRLRFLDIPYITPSVFIALLVKEDKLTLDEAREKLELLSPLVSDDEYHAVNLILQNWRIP